MRDLPPRFLEEIVGLHGPAVLVTRQNAELAGVLKSATPGLDWDVLTKHDVRGWGARRLISFLRSKPYRVMVIEDESRELHRRWDLYRGVAVLARAPRRWLLESSEDEVRAHPIGRAREIPSLVWGGLAELVATLSGLRFAKSLDRRLRETPPATGSHPEGNRIAVLRTSFWFGAKAGGSISHAVGVLDGMKELGLEPRVWTVSGLPLDPAILQAVINPERRPSLIEEAAVAAYNRTFLDQAEKEAESFSPAAVYHRHDAFSLAGVALGRRLGVPVVLEVNASEVWAREAWSRLHFGDLARSMERTAFQKADRLVLISEELVSTVLELGGDRDRIVVSPNGVDTARFNPDSRGEGVRHALGISPEEILCGFLGTFTNWHGVLFLADQVPHLVKKNPALHFLFLGDGDLRSEVEERLKRDNVSDHAHFTGLIDPGKVPEHLAACDILLSPHLPFDDGSVFFGSPTKLFEYMAAGRPVVASRLGQIGDVIEDGRSGILINPGDAEEFGQAIERLSTDEKARREMGVYARARALEEYTWKANVRRALSGLIELPTIDDHG